MTIVASVPTRSNPARRWTFAAVAAVLGGVGGAAVLSSILPHGAQPAAAPSVRSADGFITRAEVAGPALRISAELKDATQAASYVDLAGMAARAVGKQLQAGVSEDLSGVSAVEMAFAAPGGAPLMTLRIPLADLKGADYARLQWPAVLDLAAGVTLADAGRPAVAAWCAEDDNRAGAFCGRALK